MSKEKKTTRNNLFLLLSLHFYQVVFCKNQPLYYPGYQRFFLVCYEELCRPEANLSAAEAVRKKPLAQSALIYRAQWTLTLSLICQSNQPSQANSKVITKGGTTCSSPKSHIISRIASLSFDKNRCLSSSPVTVQFSLISVASI